MNEVSVDDELVGVTLDERYRLDAVLGEGGMGRVYRGTQLAVSRRVAVKVLHKNLARDDTIANRFLREAEVVSGFSHPNIVNLVDFGTDSDHGVVYLVMELLEGRELSSLLSGRRCGPALVVELADQICAALTEPHDEGVIHRDLKPNNLMVQTVSDGSVQAKILDFGIAHVVQAQTRLTETDA
ncbi:MAG: serine/threonine protein kinase, partial [Bradymonadaceae bacterium]